MEYIIWRSVALIGGSFVGQILDNYVANVPLVQDTYKVDSNHVHTLPLSLIKQYPVVKAIVHMAIMSDGCIAFMALAERFEGVGTLKVDVIEAKDIIKERTKEGTKE